MTRASLGRDSSRKEGRERAAAEEVSEGGMAMSRGMGQGAMVMVIAIAMSR